MSDIDKRLDSLVHWILHEPIYTPAQIKNKIKQLMADEFEKMIDYAEGEGEMWWSDGKDKLRQKIEEWKK